MNQTTIRNEVQIEGVGLHTGVRVRMRFVPATENQGIRFCRTDLNGKPTIPADVSRVISTNRGTTLQEGEAQVWTVEHTLSALYGLGIDNVLIELDGPEIPILDGRSAFFVKALRDAGIQELNAEREIFEITETITFEDQETGAEYVAMPSDEMEITTLIDFNSNVLGQQFASLEHFSQYAEQIAPCRTFVFVHELEHLLNQNLIKGGDMDNAIVIVDRMMTQEELDDLARKLNKPSVKVDKEGILNTVSLHYPNEPARHKLLDVIGDLSLVGRQIKGKIVTKKSGHRSNVEFAKILKKKYLETRKLKGVPVYDPNQTPVMNSIQIMELLPHRYPFLLVDKIIELTDTTVVGVKNVTMNEGLFQGHFPGNPVFPGMLQLEALAQTGGVLALNIQEDKGMWDTYFVKAENAKFRQKVLPGDTLLLKMELAAPIRRGLVIMNGTAYVGNKLVCEAELTAQIVKREA